MKSKPDWPRCVSPNNGKTQSTGSRPPPEQTGVADGVETEREREGEREREWRKRKGGKKKHSSNKSSSFSPVFYTGVPEFLHIRAKPQGHLRAQPLWAAGGTRVCGKERKKGRRKGGRGRGEGGGGGQSCEECGTGESLAVVSPAFPIGPSEKVGMREGKGVGGRKGGRGRGGERESEWNRKRGAREREKQREFLWLGVLRQKGRGLPSAQNSRR